MRLKEDRIRLICQKVYSALRAKQLFQTTKTESEILKKMEEIFIQDLKVEDKLDAEVEKLLSQYSAKMAGNVDREKLFQLIKKQLIKDKNLII